MIARLSLQALAQSLRRSQFVVVQLKSSRAVAFPKLVGCIIQAQPEADCSTTDWESGMWDIHVRARQRLRQQMRTVNTLNLNLSAAYENLHESGCEASASRNQVSHIKLILCWPPVEGVETLLYLGLQISRAEL